MKWHQIYPEVIYCTNKPGRKSNHKIQTVKKLTQSVFLFSLRSLFGIKVPDCDGIAVRHKKDILIRK